MSNRENFNEPKKPVELDLNLEGVPQQAAKLETAEPANFSLEQNRVVLSQELEARQRASATVRALLREIMVYQEELLKTSKF